METNKTFLSRAYKRRPTHFGRTTRGASSRLLFALRPDIFVFGMWVLSFVVPAVILLRGGGGIYLDRASISGSPQAIWGALLASAVLPVTTFIFGLVYGRTWIPSPHRQRLNRTGLRGGVAVAVALSVSAQILLVNLIGVRRLSSGLAERVVLFEGLNYFVNLALLATALVPIALYLMLIVESSSINALDALLLSALLISGFTAALMSGQKTSFALPLLVGVLLLIIARRFSVTKMMGFGALFGGLYFLWDKILREYMILGYFVEGPKIDFVGFAKLAWANTFPQLEALIVARTFFPQFHDFFYGGTYAPVLVAWIPRRLWANKPISPSGMLAEIVFPSLEYGNTIPPGLIGEAWINAGYTGIFIVSVFVSWFLWNEHRRCRDGRIWSQIRYSVYLASFFGFLRGESLGSLVALLVVLVPSWLMVKLARPRRVSESIRSSAWVTYTSESVEGRSS